jgi:DNA polymerase-3 subunit alpha
VITELKTKIDKSGNNMAFFKLDDFTGSCECIMFSKTFDEFGKYVREDEPVLAIGNLESSGDAVKIHISKIIPMEKVNDELTESVRIIIDKEKVKPENVAQLKNVFRKNEGSVPVFISFAENGTKGKLFALDEYRVRVNESFVKEVTRLLGEDSIILKSK